MSTTVDSRVVEMSFNNKNFESNVQTSMSTLDKLKNALNFKNSTKGLDELDTAARGVNFGVLGDAVEAVNVKFSALQVVAITALQNITNSAMEAGKRLVASLTVDQISAGFSKYADKTAAIQTIMSATAKDFEDTGEQMEYVNDQMDKLNWFTDETSYKFLDMVSNIGKFTNNGVKLDDAVTAMQGISTWAAASGANVNEAGRAMYNLSQAMAVGAVKLMDWKSIENANMATYEFKEMAIETALALGTLQKAEDGTIVTLDENAVSVTNFNEALSDGWFTSDVLMKTLNMYGSFSNELYDSVEKTGLETLTLLECVEQFKEGTYDFSKVAKEAGMTTAEFTEEIKNLSREENALGYKAFKMAQETKTFQEAIDYVKEAVSSGWMQTFEIIFGNYEEAKKLWSSLSEELYEIFVANGEARNEMLSEWKDMGGREALLESVSNLWEGIKQIAEIVKEAFREIFPPKTAEDLYNFTERLRAFTENLSLSEERAEKLKTVFKGVFSAFDIGKQAISAVASGLGTLASAILPKLAPLGKKIADSAVGFGEYLSKLDESIKKTGALKEKVNKAVSFLMKLPEKINDIFKKITGKTVGEAFNKIVKTMEEGLKKIKEFFGKFKTVDTSGVDELATDVEVKLHPITSIFEGVKKVFQGIGEAFKKLSPIFSALAKTFGGALEKFGVSISNGVAKIDLEKILDVINSGVLISIGVGISKFFKGLRGVTDSASGTIDSIKSIFSGLSDAANNMANKVKANTLMLIAAAIGILTASIIALTLVDPNKISTALGAMTAEFAELLVAFKSVSAIDAGGTKKAAMTMLIMSVAVLILTSAMKSMASLDWDGILKGAVGIGALSEILVLSAKQLSSGSTHMMKGAIGLIAFALAVKILAGPTKELSTMSWEELGKGLAGVGAIFAELTAFTKLNSDSKKVISTATGMVILGAALHILAGAVTKFGSMEVEKMKQGLIGVGAVLLELSAFTMLTGDAKRMITTSTGMVILGAAMLIFASAVEKFGNLSLEQIGKGLLAMAASLLVIGVAIALIPSNAILIGAGLIAVGAALLIISNALNSFAGLSWEQLGIGLLALGGVLAELAIALMVMNGTLAGSAALLVAAAALAVLAPVLKTLGSLSLTEIGLALLTLAGTFTVLGVAGLLLTPIVPGLLGLGAAVVLLGVGALACGAGVTVLAAGLSLLSVAGTAGIATLVLAIEALLGLLPQIAVKLGEGLIAFFETIGAASETLCEVLVQVGTAMINALDELIPKLLEFLVKILAALGEKLPLIVDFVIQALVTLLEKIRDNIAPIIDIVVDIIINTVKAIADNIPKIVQAGIDIVLGLIDGLGKGLVDNAPRLRDSLLGLLKSLLEAVLSFFGIHSPSTVFADIGKNLILGLIKGLGNMITSAVTSVKNFFGKIKDNAKENIKIFREQGSEIVNKLKTGIDENSDRAREAITGLMNSLKDRIKNNFETFKEIGGNLINGLKDGITGMADKAVTAVTNVGTKVVNGAKDLLGIHSPSTVFKEIGKFVDEGFADGISRYSAKVENASDKLGYSAINSVSDAIASISDKLSTEIDADPTISPVLDLSNVTAGVNKIDDMLFAQRAMSLSGNIDISRGSTSGMLQTASQSVTDGLLDEFEGLRSDVADLARAMSKIKVVMDTGSMVGALVTDMDMALGSRAILVGRGV